jgi:CO/xanthine dehydrogenase Mo-binding subunit
MAEGQIEGGLAQGLGYALTEGLVYDKHGCALNASYTDYKVFRAEDMPGEISTILIHTEDTQGVLGAKSLGETVMVNTAAAVANAIEDATGIRMRKLPITPEKLLQALGKYKDKNNS